MSWRERLDRLAERLPSPVARRAHGLAAAWSRGRYSAELLMEKRLWIFLVIDGLLVIGGLIEALIGGGGSEQIFRSTVFWPSLLLGLPAVSGVVALERRAGSLDLALAVPSTERYFRHRLLAIHGLLLIQGLVLVSLAHLEASSETRGEGLRVLYQCLELQVVLAAVVLFWASRLESSGAVLLASLGTAALFSPWILRSPDVGVDFWGVLGRHQRLVEWWFEALFLAAAALLFYLYARLRLRRPEALLT